jgi:acetylornithine deacetylase/succinyl-diaminopimelate desuccinylase-like protein
VTRSVSLDRQASAARIAADLQALACPPYTDDGPGITRHAFTPAYARTQEYFRRAFEQLGFDVWCDPIGNLVARATPAAMVFVPCRDGISHAPQEWADPAHGALAAHVEELST